jgi:HprK-related kinase A
MKLLQLPPAELSGKLAGPGVWLRTGPFSFRVRSDIPSVAQALAKLYSHFEIRSTHESAADFQVSVCPPSALRRWVRPLATFASDGQHPFAPSPRNEAFALLERGLTWCVSTQARRYLILQAATVEKHGRAALLCAPPGSGVSTLAAALALSGWRLLSDELTLIDRKTGLIRALPRPICLKNQSIDLIRQFAPDAILHSLSNTTRQPQVAYLRPPRDSVVCQHDPAAASWIIFPRWRGGVPVRLVGRPRAETMSALALSVLNPVRLDAADARVCSALADLAPAYDLQYGGLHEAIAAFDRLIQAPTRLTQGKSCV